MAGTSDLVAAGLGSWSTASRLITKGLDSADPTPPADGSLEWLVPDTQLHWSIENTRLDYVIPNTRLEWTASP